MKGRAVGFGADALSQGDPLLDAFSAISIRPREPSTPSQLEQMAFVAS